MDPHVSDPLLQKTSPTQDPAAVSQLTTEVSAQASMLAAHHHQLQRLTSLTEELSKTLQALCNIAAPPSQTPPPAALSQSTSPSMTSPRLSFPEKYDGTPNKCKGFLLQCTIFMDQQPHLYPTDDSRVPFVCSLLTGRALDWATAVWEGGNMAFPSFRNFMQQFREVFDHAVDGKEVGEQLLALRQGSSTAADYALTFRTLAAQTGWANDPLKLLFRKGLTTDLQSELACRDEGRTLEQFIELTIRIDNLMRSRAWPPQRIQSYPHQRGGWVENSLFHHKWALRISGYAVRASQQSISLSGFHQRCVPGHVGSVGDCVHGWYISLLRHSGLPCSTCKSSIKTPHWASVVCQNGEVWVSSDSNIVSGIYH